MTRVGSTLKACQERNIEVEISLIFGLPNQTLASFEESVRYCINHGVRTIHAFPLMLLRGTELYHQKEPLRLVESSDVDIPSIPRQQQDIPHVIASPTFSVAEWCKMADIARWLEEEYNTKNIKPNLPNQTQLLTGFTSPQKAINTETPPR